MNTVDCMASPGFQSQGISRDAAKFCAIEHCHVQPQCNCSMCADVLHLKFQCRACPQAVDTLRMSQLLMQRVAKQALFRGSSTSTASRRLRNLRTAHRL